MKSQIFRGEFCTELRSNSDDLNFFFRPTAFFLYISEIIAPKAINKIYVGNEVVGRGSNFFLNLLGDLVEVRKLVALVVWKSASRISIYGLAKLERDKKSNSNVGQSISARPSFLPSSTSALVFLFHGLPFTFAWSNCHWNYNMRTIVVACPPSVFV